MEKLSKLLLIPTILLLTACAHTIQITPDSDKLRAATPPSSTLSVAYYISPSDKTKQVTSPGGGGDKISYLPYKDAEAPLNIILSNLYKNVFTAPSATDKDFIAGKKITYVFSPTITTTSSSSSAFTWPPTDFSMTIECAALDADGREVWRDKVTGTGHAEFSEFKADFPLAAKRATEDAFRKLQEKISSSALAK